MIRHRILVLSIVFFAGIVSVRAFPTADQIRAATGKYIRENNAQEGIETFADVLADRFRETVHPGGDRLAIYSLLADCVRLMEMTEKAPLSAELSDWLLASDQRVRGLVNIVLPEDDLKQVLEIIEKLALHDPAGRDQYFDLILALAVVWDVPQRPLLHGQMGDRTLPYAPDVEARYDYFKALYLGEKAKLDYEALSVYDLVFVVDTPVPLSELQWVLEHVSGDVDSWTEKFQAVNYDQRRLEHEQYVWPHGSYTLAAIRKQGGICVDQAYYCVLTARAYGIPSLYFQAIGSGGGHAWFSYLRSARTWALDVGRYESQNYTTGYALNPQTGRPMTDHDVEFACERSLNDASQVRADCYMSVANVIRDRDPGAARLCAREARKLCPKDLTAWMLELELLSSENDAHGMISLFGELKDAFRKYPDILADAAARIQTALLAQGRTKEAEQMVKSLSGVVGDDRDDLSRTLEMARIEQLARSGKVAVALRELEQLLEKQVAEGSKLLPLVAYYVQLALENGFEKQAASFLEEYVEELFKKTSVLPYYQRQFLTYLVSVYDQTGDLEGKKRIQAQLKTCE